MLLHIHLTGTHDNNHYRLDSCQVKWRLKVRINDYIILVTCNNVIQLPQFLLRL